MRISGLIRELEKIKCMYGDLDVVKGNDYVGSEAVTGVKVIRAHECYIVNDYLDNYTKSNKDKLKLVMEDLTAMLDGLHCSDCEHYTDNHCYFTGKEIGDDGLCIGHFERKDRNDDWDYDLMMMQNCYHKLERRLERGERY